MYRAFAIILCSLYFIGLFCSNNALTDEQRNNINEAIERFGKPCETDNPITEDDKAALRARKVPTGPNSPCFIACMLRNAAVMDDNGKINKEVTLELGKVILGESNSKNTYDYVNSCMPVNNVEVSDGTKGCDRARMLYKCLAENLSKFGFGKI